MENKSKDINKPEAYKREIDTINQEGVDFYITVNNCNILHRLGLLPKKQKFVIYPINLGTVLKISKILIDINAKELENLKENDEINLLDTGVKNIVENKDKLVKIAAYGILNRKKEPSQRFFHFLDDNLISQELLQIMILIINKMDITPFCSATVLVKGINLLSKEN